MKTELFLMIPTPPLPSPPVLSQYCPSTVSVLPQYCLSSPLSTVSVLSQYCPSTVPSPIPLEPPLGFSGETEKKGLWLFLKKHMIHGWKKVFMVGSTTGHKKVFSDFFRKVLRVLYQYCLSTVPVLPLYCLSSPVSTGSVLSQYCPSTGSVLPQ